MISEEAIKNFATKYQTTEENIRREYFQHLFLSYFYAQPETDKIYFKGGTALRLIFRSPRFSEDLDFSSGIKNVKKIEQAVAATLAQIEKEGIGVSIIEAKETTGGYLALAHFKANGGFIPIQLEISFREGKKAGELKTITNDFIPAYTVVGLMETELIGEKIQALLNRKKPRDFYDLYFILRDNRLPVEERKILPAALKALQDSNIRFDQELKKFLPKSHWAIIRDFPATLEREIKRFIK